MLVGEHCPEKDGRRRRSIDKLGKESSVFQAQVRGELRPLAEPQEPVEMDAPVKCPAAQPAILHDGRLLKESLERATSKNGHS